jgi:hypothetical protein
VRFKEQSRRDFLKEGACALAGPSDLLRAANAFGSEEHVTAVMPFTFHGLQGALDDLKFRLARTRLPDRETGPGWSEGVPIDKLRAGEILAEWLRLEALRV